MSIIHSDCGNSPGLCISPVKTHRASLVIFLFLEDGKLCFEVIVQMIWYLWGTFIVFQDSFFMNKWLSNISVACPFLFWSLTILRRKQPHLLQCWTIILAGTSVSTWRHTLTLFPIEKEKRKAFEADFMFVVVAFLLSLLFIPSLSLSLVFFFPWTVIHASQADCGLALHPKLALILPPPLTTASRF